MSDQHEALRLADELGRIYDQLDPLDDWRPVVDAAGEALRQIPRLEAARSSAVLNWEAACRRVAELERVRSETHCRDGTESDMALSGAAAELRRQHAEIERLTRELATAIEQYDAEHEIGESWHADAMQAMAQRDAASVARIEAQSRLADALGEVARLEPMRQRAADIDLLTAERDVLAAWKESALASWPPIREIAKAIGVPLGEAVHDKILSWIERSIADRDAIGRMMDALQDERDALRADLAALRAQEPVAWDVYEHRIYGAQGEKRHRVLWVEDYRHSDGVVRDLDGLLESARERGIDNGARTIHVRPLYSAPIVSAPAAQIEAIASEIESAIQTMPGKLLANLIREGVTALQSHIVYAMAPMPPPLRWRSR